MAYKTEITELLKEFHFKNQLITKELDELFSQYESIEKYKEFIEISNRLLKNETVFFYIDESFLTKVQEIIHKYRFDYRKDKNINDLINETIYIMNSVKSKLNNDQQVDTHLMHYYYYQENSRGISIEDEDVLLYALSEDYNVLKALIENDFFEISDDIFLVSTNYFLEVYPEIYQDKQIKEITEKKLDAIVKNNFDNSKVIKEYTTSTKKLLQKKTVKGE